MGATTTTSGFGSAEADTESSGGSGGDVDQVKGTSFGSNGGNDQPLRHDVTVQAVGVMLRFTPPNLNVNESELARSSGSAGVSFCSGSVMRQGSSKRENETG
jgi:hypothetical protein